MTKSFAFVLCVLLIPLVAAQADKEQQKICEKKFSYIIRWEKRHCAAHVLGGDITNPTSALPEKYKAIFGDTIPRESLVSREALREWTCGDFATRFAENSKGTFDATTLDGEANLNSYKKCLATEQVKKINEETCVKKNKMAETLSKEFLACLDRHVGQDKDCWKSKITQPLTADNVVEFMCQSPSNVEKIHSAMFCAANPNDVLQCVGNAYTNLTVE